MSLRWFKVTWSAHAMASTRAAYYSSLQPWISLHSQIDVFTRGNIKCPIVGHRNIQWQTFTFPLWHSLYTLSLPSPLLATFPHLPGMLRYLLTEQLDSNSKTYISFVITSLGLSWSPPCMHLLRPPVQYLPSSSCTLYKNTMSSTSMWMPTYFNYVLACDFCWRRYHTCMHMKA